MKEITIKYTIVFERTLKGIMGGYRIIMNRGSSRSSKTHSVLQVVAGLLVNGYLIDREGKRFDFPKGVISIARRYLVTTKKSVFRDFKRILTDDFEFPYHKYLNKSEMTIEYKGRIVEFIGADDEDKLKGPGRDILVCNEVTEFGYREFKQLLMRTKMFALLDFNPDDIDSRIKTEIEDKRRVIQKDVKLIVSTFKDNPFLPVAQRKEIEQMKESDPELRKVYGEGKYTKKTGLIYGDMVVIDKIPEDARYIGTGLDFGFVNSKTAVVDIYYKDKGLYRDEIVYSTGLLNRDISNEMEDAGKIKDETYIVADSAEHKSIIELRELGRDIEGADKGNDSVHFGIQYVKKFKRFVTARSVNIRKEDRNYKRKIGPDGKITNKPVKKFDDAFDAGRYLIMKALFVDHAEDEDWGDIDMYDDSLYLL